jgi:hypothetical protein
MIHTTLTINPQTICWHGVGFVDWASAGCYYSVEGKHYNLASSHSSGVDWDACVASPDGRYALIFARLGTKALLLKEGELLREVNRSYYQANAYEYPAAFFEHEGRTYLAHCPQEYNRLEFEDVETGEIPTDIPEREPCDVFISRLLVSPGQTWLLHQGWFWHPYGMVEAFDIGACLRDPTLLDNSTRTPVAVGSEVSSASFLDDDTVLLAASAEEPLGDEPALPPNRLAWWNLQTNELSAPIAAPGKRGLVIAINAELAWDLYEHPKLLNLTTGAVEQRWESVNSGKQNAAYYPDTAVQIVHSPDRGLLVVKTPTAVEVIALG